MLEVRMPTRDEEVLSTGELSTGELSTGELSTGELLVEEVSIDGMCGVY
jgi:mycofactocin precursor